MFTSDDTDLLEAELEWLGHSAALFEPKDTGEVELVACNAAFREIGGTRDNAEDANGLSELVSREEFRVVSSAILRCAETGAPQRLEKLEEGGAKGAMSTIAMTRLVTRSGRVRVLSVRGPEVSPPEPKATLNEVRTTHSDIRYFAAQANMRLHQISDGLDFLTTVGSASLDINATATDTLSRACNTVRRLIEDIEGSVTRLDDVDVRTAVEAARDTHTPRSAGSLGGAEALRVS